MISDPAKALWARIEKAEAQNAETEQMLREVLASAAPNPIQHPTMWAAWRKANALFTRRTTEGLLARGFKMKTADNAEELQALRARVAELEREKATAENETREAYYDLCAVLAWTFNGIGSASNVKRAARELLRLHDERKLSISHGLVVR